MFENHLFGITESHENFYFHEKSIKYFGFFKFTAMYNKIVLFTVGFNNRPSFW